MNRPRLRRLILAVDALRGQLVPVNVGCAVLILRRRSHLPPEPRPVGNGNAAYESALPTARFRRSVAGLAPGAYVLRIDDEHAGQRA